MNEVSKEVSAEWSSRQRYWQGQLGRLRLGAEPLGQQLLRYRNVSWALTIVPAVIAAIFVALFTAFGAAPIGWVLGGLVLFPIAAVAWMDYWKLKTRVAGYECERREFESRMRS
jgi:hypothetical protein